MSKVTETVVASTLEELEKELQVVQKNHQNLNGNTQIELEVSPDPSTVKFDKALATSFTVNVNIIK